MSKYLRLLLVLLPRVKNEINFQNLCEKVFNFFFILFSNSSFDSDRSSCIASGAKLSFAYVSRIFRLSVGYVFILYILKLRAESASISMVDAMKNLIRFSCFRLSFKKGRRSYRKSIRASELLQAPMNALVFV